MTNSYKESIVILDFGSQYTQLIARRVRECKVYCEILPYDTELSVVRQRFPRGIILSGGPASLTAKESPLCDPQIFNLGLPVLGICYGMQLEGRFLGGTVSKATQREYGYAEFYQAGKSKLFRGMNAKFSVWMSHGDKVSSLPQGFKVIGKTANSHIAAMADEKRFIYGVQFHPEVVHTAGGKKIIENFLYGIAGCSKSWDMKSFVKKAIEEVRQTVGEFF